MNNPSNFWPGDHLESGNAQALHDLWVDATPLPRGTILPRRFSGVYSGINGTTRLDLRVDIDGYRPMVRLSGDLVEPSGNTSTYIDSLVADRITFSVDATTLAISGIIRTAQGADFEAIKVSFARPTGVSALKAVSVQLLTNNGESAAYFECALVSRLLRTINIEHDRVAAVSKFESAQINLPAVEAARRGAMTIKRAYAEAGIDLGYLGAASIVDMDLAAADVDGDAGAWTDAELFAAMQQNFSRITDLRAWRIYLLSAGRHEGGYRGSMFDNGGRRGCATFDDAIRNDPDHSVDLSVSTLRTYVHEIGHCLNLKHSDEKPGAGLAALSWMNVPWKYKNGNEADAPAYWKNFGCGFEDQELVHLRHGFYDAVVPGGDSFAGNSSQDLAAKIFSTPFEDFTGLALKITAPHRVKLGAPIVVTFKLKRVSRGTTPMSAALHPAMGRTLLCISGPGGRVRQFQPLASHCSDEHEIPLTRQAVSQHASAYIGFGRDGHYFDWPGRYTIVAVHICTDGSRLVSNKVTLHVDAPLDNRDATACELFLGSEAGQLLALLGSDCPSLDAGRNAMQLAVDRFPDHDLTDYARLVLGINAARNFKAVDRGNRTARLTVRKRQTDDAIATLEPLIATAISTRHRAASLDPISLTMAATRLGVVLRGEGRFDRVRGLASGIDAHLERQSVPQRIRKRVRLEIGGIGPEQNFKQENDHD